MNHKCNHRLQTSQKLSANAISNFDPTRTLSLRNAFAREFAKRFRRLRGAIRRALITEDVFALMRNSGGFALLGLAESMGKAGNVHVPIRANQVTTPGRHAFDFPRSADKVEAFMQWLNRQVETEMLEITEIPQLGTASEQAWTSMFISDSYERGAARARAEMVKAGYDVPSLAATGGAELSFSTPLHIDRLGLLYTRVFSDLKGITNTMDAQISRVLAQAMADGKGPREIARLLTKTISGPVGKFPGITDTLGRFIPAERRAKMLARTEVIRAHAEGQLTEYENWRVAGVRVLAEFVTAGDDRVCVVCESLEGEIMTVAEARGLIPVHPQCRCMFLPTDPKELLRELRPAIPLAG